jgi:hypothetical protein
MTSPADSIAKAELLLDQQLKNRPGWRKQFVEPPWRGAPPKCRGCGRDPQDATSTLKWANVTIVKAAERRKILWYTFALCCETCAKSRATLNRITVEAFAPLTPPGPVPDGPPPPPATGVNGTGMKIS